MVNEETKSSFTERLIEQDAGISQTSLKEQRMNIENTLVSLDDKAKRSQRLAVLASAAVVVCQVFGYAFNAAGPSLAYRNVIGPVWIVCIVTALITAAVAIVRYWTIHRPQLEKGRVDLQVAMFKELQRQISELQNQR